MTSRRPPSQRNASSVQQRMARQLQSMVPGAENGRLASAGPVKQFSGPPDALFGFDGGVASAASRASKVDIFTLAADGAQDLTLTYVPVEDSWNVLHNTSGLYETEHFTISSNILSLAAGVDALVTGDKIRVQYDFLEEQSDPIADVPPLDVPFSSTGWKYTHDDPGAGWEQPDFDDSGWSTGQMPIGNTAYSAYADDDPNTVVPSTMNPVPNEIWVRRKLGPGTTIIFSYRMAKYLQVYVDGTLYTSQTFGGYHTATDLFPRIPDQTGIWTLAATVYDFSWVGAGPDFDIGINLEISGDEA